MGEEDRDATIERRVDSILRYGVSITRTTAEGVEQIDPTDFYRPPLSPELEEAIGRIERGIADIDDRHLLDLPSEDVRAADLRLLIEALRQR